MIFGACDPLAPRAWAVLRLGRSLSESIKPTNSPSSWHYKEVRLVGVAISLCTSEQKETSNLNIVNNREKIGYLYRWHRIKTCLGE